MTRPALGRVAVGVLVALVVGGLVVALVVGARVRDARELADQRADAVAQARQLATNFVTLDYTTFDHDVQLVLDGSTGAFRDQFRAGVQQTRELVTRNRSVSIGTVTQAALVSGDGDSARVLLVVDTEVTNAASPQPSPRNYRVELDLRRTGDRWLASDLRFVG